MKVDFVRSEDGDWEGLYIDEKLVREEHSLDPEMVLDCLGIRYAVHVWGADDYDSSLDENLSDVKLLQEKH